MKSKMKAVIIAMMTFLACYSAKAQVPGDVFESNGVMYRVWSTHENTASVIESPNKYRDLRDVVIPETVTYKGVTFTVNQIEDKAFYESAITSVEIPGTVKRIGDSAFDNSPDLTRVSMGEGVEFIGEYAFRRTKVEEINFPESLKVVESCVCEITPWDGNQPAGEIYAGKTFYRYKYDSNKPLPESVQVSIKDGTKIICGDAFYNVRLSDIKIPESVTSIGGSAFRNCSKLTKIELPAGLSYCNGTAFWGCPALDSYEGDVYAGKVYLQHKGNASSVEIKEGTTMIADGAFKGQDQLRSVSIPQSVKYIADDAFMNCLGLKALELPDGLKRINRRSFFGCGNVESLKLPAQLEIIEYLGTASSKVTDVDIPACLNFIPNESLEGLCNQRFHVHKDNKAFSDIDGVLTTADRKKILMYPDQRAGSFIIPDGVTNIGENAFQLSSITDVTVPASVTKIEPGAFSVCTLLEKVTFEEPSALTEIPVGMCNSCYVLKSVNIPSGIRKIGKSAFRSCGQLEKIELPAALEDIGDYAFDKTAWYNAQPDGVMYLKDFAYSYKGTPGADLAIKEGTRVMCGGFCSDVKEVKSVTLPSTLERVNKYAFENSGVEKITGGEKAVMDYGVLKDTPWFKSYPEKLVYYGVSSLGCKRAHKTGDELIIKDGTEIINITCYLRDQYGIHYDLGLRKIEIPSSAKYIASGALEESKHISQVVIKTPFPPEFLSDKDRLTKWNVECTLIVPPYGLEAYKNHPVWGAIRNIISDPTAVEGVVADEAEDLNAPMFNVMGQQIEQPYNGQIYIQNGKKKVYRE